MIVLKKGSFFALFLVVLFFSLDLFARDFSQAANSFYDQAKQLRPAVCGGGLVVFGLLSFFMSNIRIFMTAVGATAAAYAGPAILNFFQMIFGI